MAHLAWKARCLFRISFAGLDWTDPEVDVGVLGEGVAVYSVRQFQIQKFESHIFVFYPSHCVVLYISPAQIYKNNIQALSRYSKIIP